MRRVIGSIEAEYRRYKALGAGAIAQLADRELSTSGGGEGNSVAVMVWHVAGNLASRFTDFLRSDGEKLWRHREEEFADRTVTRDELLVKWEQGWTVLFEALAGLTDEHLTQQVTIRGQSLAVHDALHRSLAHTSYHVGQIVYLARSLRGDDWRLPQYPAWGICGVQPKPNARAAQVAHRKIRPSVDCGGSSRRRGFPSPLHLWRVQHVALRRLSTKRTNGT